MNSAAAGEAWTLRSIRQALGLSRGVVAGLVAAGFVSPTRGPRNEYRFSFQDVVLLRTAHALRAAKIPPRRIVRSLQRLRSTLPERLPLSGLRITAVGNAIAVRDGATHWEPESGQLLFDFELAPARHGSVALLQRAPQPAPGRSEADAWFERGAALEADDAPAAERAYRAALALAPGHVDACLNLGVLLCESGHCDDAVAIYSRTLALRPAVALLHYNLGVALEDRGDAAAAIAAYECSLQLDPKLADAHYNAARLHEQLGHAQLALRHYSAYRRLQR